MDKKKVAKELLKLAKELVAVQSYQDYLDTLKDKSKSKFKSEAQYNKAMGIDESKGDKELSDEEWRKKEEEEEKQLAEKESYENQELSDEDDEKIDDALNVDGELDTMLNKGYKIGDISNAPQTDFSQLNSELQQAIKNAPKYRSEDIFPNGSANDNHAFSTEPFFTTEVDGKTYLSTGGSYSRYMTELTNVDDGGQKEEIKKDISEKIVENIKPKKPFRPFNFKSEKHPKLNKIFQKHNMTDEDEVLKHLAGFKKTLGAKGSGRDEKKLKADFLKEMDPMSYASVKEFKEAKRRIQEMNPSEFGIVLALLNEDEDA